MTEEVRRNQHDERVKAIFDEVLRRLPDITPAGESQRLRSNFINGIKHLPVTF